MNMSDAAIDSIESPSTIKIRIKASKTDKFRRGVDIYFGRTHNQICPVEVLLAYIHSQKRKGIRHTIQV